MDRSKANGITMLVDGPNGGRKRKTSGITGIGPPKVGNPKSGMRHTMMSTTLTITTGTMTGTTMMMEMVHAHRLKDPPVNAFLRNTVDIPRLSVDPCGLTELRNVRLDSTTLRAHEYK